MFFVVMVFLPVAVLLLILFFVAVVVDDIFPLFVVRVAVGCCLGLMTSLSSLQLGKPEVFPPEVVDDDNVVGVFDFPLVLGHEEEKEFGDVMCSLLSDDDDVILPTGVTALFDLFCCF